MKSRRACVIPDSMDMGSDVVGHFDWGAPIERRGAGPFAIGRFATLRLTRRAAVQGPLPSLAAPLQWLPHT